MSHNTLASTVLCLALASQFAACQQQPRGFLRQTLNPKLAVQEADLIVLAYPVSRRDVGHQRSIPRQGEDVSLPPLRIMETETTLAVMQVFKGAQKPQELRFRHYDARDYSFITGPPKGASGPMGSRGIFFLRRQPDGIFRSFVDIFRPDIPTPWIFRQPESEPCAPPDCVAKFLLTYHPSDDAQSFSSQLLKNVAISEQVTGFLNTFELLSALTARTNPNVVTQQACLEMSKWYALEFPSVCNNMVVANARQDALAQADRLRKALQEGGLSWVQRHIGTMAESQVTQYLRLLTTSSNQETRALAERLLRSAR